MCKSKMEKMTAIEALEYVSDLGLDWEDRAEVVRECKYCGAFVPVEEFAGEWEYKGDIHYDICDDCRECIEEGSPIEEFDNLEDTEEFDDLQEELFGGRY